MTAFLGDGLPRLTAFQRAVLDWAEAGAGADGGLRDLPWRRTRDPWAVLVSEVMLQQTQVTRVVPRWKAFLDRLPDPATCALAPVGEVIGLWVGLGYNRRAVQLRRAATEVVARHGGQLPSTLPELLALPGVGPYTARAVLAFAWEQPAAVVDTNVARVLARAVAGHRLAPIAAQATADSLVPAQRSWAWNQAMLDLGARHCRSRPSCSGCPLRTGLCAWSGAGAPDPDPARGSAGVSGRQPPFIGSDRQGRGRLVRALQTGPVALVELAEAAGWPGQTDRAARVAASLVADGLAVEAAGWLQLP